MSNNRYTTPEKGTTDWHIPLNENFVRLDKDVEIRDLEENLDGYDPVSGAKFLATDTGGIFLGTGSKWQRFGAIPSGTSGFASDGSIVAQPGDVQSAIDDAEANGGGVVKLDSTQTYIQPASPWQVKPHVVLDFNGAIMLGHGSRNDTDIIHVHPCAQVHNPKIDLWDEWNAYHKSNPYGARVFTFDSKYGAYFADGTTILGGWTMAVESTGTWMYFGKNNPSDKRVNHVTCITIDTNLRKVNEPTSVGPKVIDTGIHLDSSGPDGYLNSIVFRGIWRGAGTMILQEGKHPNNEHIFDAVIQPPAGADYLWHITPGTFARGSVVRGKVWDVNSGTYPDGVAWLIDSQYDEGGNQRTQNNAINARGFPPSLAVNNSVREHYVTDPATGQQTII